jgi:23S rRNA (pseudouridine1915-N3)-methyltransferase
MQSRLARSCACGSRRAPGRGPLRAGFGRGPRAGAHASDHPRRRPAAQRAGESADRRPSRPVRRHRARPWVSARRASSKWRTSAGAVPSAEADLLLAAAPEGPLIALDERGALLDSPDLAKRLATFRDDGARDLSFAIGGADGHGAALRARAALTLSFGPMVWPHMLARAMLAEQLYRAATILAGGPYHRV